jgi:hypothetical protein
VRQRTDEGQAATMAKVANRQALGEKNFLRADIISKITEANH